MYAKKITKRRSPPCPVLRLPYVYTHVYVHVYASVHARAFRLALPLCFSDNCIVHLRAGDQAAIGDGDDDTSRRDE